MLITRKSRKVDLTQVDLFGHTPTTTAAPQRRLTELTAEQIYLATPAAFTLRDNMPAIDESSPWWHRVMINVDGSGPGSDAPRGCTLADWSRIQTLLREAWCDHPRASWPAILTAKRPTMDDERRRQIYRLAKRWPGLSSAKLFTFSDWFDPAQPVSRKALALAETEVIRADPDGGWGEVNALRESVAKHNKACRQRQIDKAS